MPRTLGALAVLAAAFLLVAGILVTPALADGGRTLFITSAHENGDGTATLPLHTGKVNGQPVDFIILDTSSGALSQRLGVNESQKLANAGPYAVQKVTLDKQGVWNFQGTVNFTAQAHIVTPDPKVGFPPLAAQPAALGDAYYSPLVQLPDGTIVNAPHVRNASGHADKAVAFGAGTVTMRETDGFQGGNAVKYISTDSSDPVAAALEDVTYAPRLNKAPTAGDDSTDSSRASLAAFVNGQTGATNPQRQGLNSALLDGLSPLNVLRWNPSQGRYSPLWDVHFAQWTAPAIASGQRVRETDWGTIQGLVDDGKIIGFPGGPFVADGIIVDCPIVSSSN